MPCYSPIACWRSQAGRNPATDKWPITMSPSKGFSDMELNIPCGKCLGCRIDASKAWAIRCVHEAKQFDKNCFITLTYNDEFLPGTSLVPEHFTKFMKRLRKKYGKGIRYFMSGEYGTLRGRPHFHACLFNFDFDDKYKFMKKDDYYVYRSASLEELWSEPYTHRPYGWATIGEVNIKTAAYIARYTLKKIYGSSSADHYRGRIPEYIRCSTRPGIGREWIKKWYKDVYPLDYVFTPDMHKQKPPRYYDKFLEEVDLEMYKKVKLFRKQYAEGNEKSLSELDRILEVFEYKISRLTRNID